VLLHEKKAAAEGTEAQFGKKLKGKARENTRWLERTEARIGTNKRREPVLYSH
jgi:hypothetical protein